MERDRTPEPNPTDQVLTEQKRLFEAYYTEHIVGNGRINMSSTPGIRRVLGMTWQAAWDAALKSVDAIEGVLCHNCGARNAADQWEEGDKCPNCGAFANPICGEAVWPWTENNLCIIQQRGHPGDHRDALGRDFTVANGYR